jgi:hypothetical protein
MKPFSGSAIPEHTCIQKTGFLPSHRSDALYQGTTLVGPFEYGTDEAFSPLYESAFTPI